MRPVSLALPLALLALSAEGYPSRVDDIGFFKTLRSLGSSIYGEPDEKTGKAVEKYDAQSGVNPEELGEYVQGDILFTKDPTSAGLRNGLTDPSARWPGAIVPYKISSTFSAADKKMVNSAMDEFHKDTCIRFVPKQPRDMDYLLITNTHSGCWASVGRIGGEQTVNLQTPGCTGKIGTVMHELMHALGFFHEQARWERDDYVTINWQHIADGRENNFSKEDKSKVDGRGVPYDYNSVMHYSAKAFSKDGKDTITPKKGQVELGQRRGFSEGDRKKLRAMYKCVGSKTLLTD